MTYSEHELEFTFAKNWLVHIGKQHSHNKILPRLSSLGRTAEALQAIIGSTSAIRSLNGYLDVIARPRLHSMQRVKSWLRPWCWLHWRQRLPYIGGDEQKAPSVDTSKASTARRWRRGGGWKWGGGIPPQSSRGLEERRRLPPDGFGRSPGQNWILHNLNGKETIWWHILHWIFYLTLTLKLCSCAWHKNLLCIFYAKYNQKAKWRSPQSVYVCATSFWRIKDLYNPGVWRLDGLTDRRMDRQADRHTDRLLIARPRLHSMQCDKKQVRNGLQFATH